MDFDTNVKIQALLEKLKTRAAAKGFTITNEDAKDELENALLEYYNDRHFTPTEERPYEDVYAGIIIQLAISSIAKIGAEGQVKHDEGGIGRTYDNGSNYPLDLTRKIIPLAKGIGNA